MSEEISYRGKLIQELSIDELRAALAECISYARATAEMHEQHIATLRNLIAKDEHDAEQLFRHATRG